MRILCVSIKDLMSKAENPKKKKNRWGQGGGGHARGHHKMDNRNPIQAQPRGDTVLYC